MRTQAGLVLLLACFSVPAWAQTVILLADENYPPYAYRDRHSGAIGGIYVDFVRAIAHQLEPDYQLDIKAVPWKRGLAYLQSGTYLGLISPFVNPERKYIAPYSQALLTEKVVLHCRPEQFPAGKYQFPDDFAQAKIGLNAGFTLGAPIIEARKAGKILVEEAPDNAANLQKLARGRIDCYACDPVAAQYSLKMLRAEGLLEDFALHQTLLLQSEDTYIGYSASFSSPYKSDFIQRMDKAIRKGKEAGLFEKILSEYR